MDKQFQILIDYNITGIACYYYWFSTNTNNLDNMLMRDPVNNLFSISNSYCANVVSF